MDDTAIGKHLMETLLTLTWSPSFCFHFDEEHLVVINLEAKEVKETVWQSLNDVLPVHAEKFTCIGPEDFAAVFGECHHGEFLSV